MIFQSVNLETQSLILILQELEILLNYIPIATSLCLRATSSTFSDLHPLIVLEAAFTVTVLFRNDKRLETRLINKSRALFG